MSTKAGDLHRMEFTVPDLATGLTFTLSLSKDGVDNATSQTQVDIGGGRYSIEFTPATAGAWFQSAYHASYGTFYKGWTVTTGGEPVTDTSGQVTVGSIATAERNAIADALLDRTNAIDGETVRKALAVIAAATAGKCTVSADGSSVTFYGLDGSTVRVTSTINTVTFARTAETYP